MRWSRRTIVVFTTISMLIFFILTMFLRNADVLIMMRALQITSSFAVVIRFWHAACIAWKEDFRNAAQVYAFSMTVLSIAIGANAIWLWLWRSADEPRWVVDSWVNGYFVLLTYLAQNGKIVAPGLSRGKAQFKSYIYISATIICGIALGIIGLLDQSYAIAFLKFIEPLTREGSIAGPPGLNQLWPD